MFTREYQMQSNKQRETAAFKAIYQTSIQPYDVQFQVRPALGLYLGYSVMLQVR